MKKTILSILGLLILIVLAQAQTDTMYIMKSGKIIGYYKVSEVDSVIFYKPQAEMAITVTDIDGNVYNTIIIGTQLWMKENLKTTRYRNGDTIGTTVPAAKDISAESIPKYQWVYDNNAGNLAIYGRLYTWYAVSDVRNVCPLGWHVPTKDELITLGEFLNGDSIAGGKLKETGIIHWNSPNAGATNETGFNALPGGYRNTYGSFGDVGNLGFWWCINEYNSNNAFNYYLYNENDDLGIIDNYKKGAFSVRCIKD